ncbi:unnamed protein product [Tuber aestivum]|uniref:Uncharacterized protein n=1 Tax=Tuber aestivum TaxID=59557 RepID=A0A292PSA5_9PEZI|nr:unnamed protein product [Tuber aestivum]
MSADQPREVCGRPFKTPDNNQPQLQQHRFHTPAANNVSTCAESADLSPAGIILHLSNADRVEAMSSAELRTRTGGQIFLTKPVDVFQPTGKPRPRRAENREDSWLCRRRGGLSIRVRTNVGAITPTRIAARRGFLGDGLDGERSRLGGVEEGDEGEAGDESVDLLEVQDGGEYSIGAEPPHETEDLDGDVLMGEAD